MNISKANLATLAFLAVSVLAVPVAVTLIKETQILKSQADQPPIQAFQVSTGDTNTALPTDSSGKPVTTSRTIKIKLTAPSVSTASKLELISTAYAAVDTHGCDTDKQTWSSCNFTCADGTVVSGGFCWGRGINPDGACTSAGRCPQESQGPTSCNPPLVLYTNPGSGNRACVACGQETDYRDGRCVPKPTPTLIVLPTTAPTPTGSRGAQGITATSFIFTDSPTDSQNPVTSDSNTQTGSLSGGEATINSYTLSATEPGDKVLFAKFTYSNNSSRIERLVINYNPNYQREGALTLTPIPPTGDTNASPSPTRTPAEGEDPAPAPTDNQELLRLQVLYSCPSGLQAVRSAEIALTQSSQSQAVYSQTTANFDREGYLQDAISTITQGQNYTLTVKGEFGLRKTMSFIGGQQGTPLVLESAWGDLAPPGSQDNIVNELDNSAFNSAQAEEVNMQAADFNGDGVVNGFDRDCLNANFNKQGDR